jgi:hypothetical protein
VAAGITLITGFDYLVAGLRHIAASDKLEVDQSKPTSSKTK